MKQVLIKESYKIICDKCEKDMDGYEPVHLEFSYPSPMDGTSLDFCGLVCLNEYIKEVLE